MRRYFEWSRLLSHWLKDVRLGVAALCLLMIFRVVLLVVFKPSFVGDASDFWLFFVRGFQFDLRIASIMVIPLAVLALFTSNTALGHYFEKFRLWYGSAFLILTLLLEIGNIGFFSEYHDQYNHWVFGLIYDDFQAILSTIWYTYPIVWLGPVVVILSIGLVFSLRKLLRIRLNFVNNLGVPLKLFLSILIIALIAVGARGSVGRRPLQRKDIAITQSAFLNKIIPSPYYALYFAFKDYKLQMGANGIENFIPSGSTLDALKAVFPEKHLGPESSLDDWLRQEVISSTPKVKAKHVFVIVMESQDSWPMLDKYESLGLMPRIKALANEGIWVPSFLSSGGGTMPSLAAIIAGMPEVGTYTHTQPSSREPYPTAIATQFKKLGYKTNLFYGGYLSWQRLGDFALDQGFDHVYGGNDMGDWEGNEWGVHDKQLFEYILTKLDSDVPTFNLIMTTSNHPRYVVDLEAEGCPVCEIPESIKPYYDGSVNLRILGHFWYADRCVGDFVEEVNQRHSPTLFAITGDHWSRHFLNKNPTLYERKSVPLVLYGPEVLQGVNKPANVAGSHLDIAPTLLDILSDRRGSYYSLGRNILDESKRQIGFGVDAVVTPDSIWEMNNNQPIEQTPWAAQEPSEDTGELSYLYNALHGVGWFRIMKGVNL